MAFETGLSISFALFVAFGSFFVKMSTTEELPWKPCKWDFWSTSQKDGETGLFKNKNIFSCSCLFIGNTCFCLHTWSP